MARMLTTLLFAVAGLAAWPVATLAACSGHMGKVVFNELYSTNSGNFIELKVNDPSVVSDTTSFANWKIAVYAGGASQVVGVNSVVTTPSQNTCGQTSLWLRFPETIMSFLSTYDPNSTGMNFVLYEDNGTGAAGKLLIDVFRVRSGTTSLYGPGTNYASCPSIEAGMSVTVTGQTFTDSVSGSGSSVKNFFRSPDGTGMWSTNTANKDSSCGSNNGTSAGTFGMAKVPSLTRVFTANNFTYTLYAINGATAVSTPASVVITDNLNTAGLTFVSCSASQGTTSGTSSGPIGTCTHSGGIVTWTVGAMAANKQYKVTLTVQAPTGGLKTNTLVSNVGISPYEQASAAAVLVNAPLVDYRMDEGSWTGTASEVADSGPNNLPGTITSSGASTLAAQVCNGGSFTTGYVTVPYSPVLTPTNATFTFWVYRAASGGTYPVFSKNSAGSYDFVAWIDSSSKMNFGWGAQTSGVPANKITTTSTIPLNAWTHVAIVFDKANNSQAIYLNGSSAASGTSTGALGTAANPFTIGYASPFASYLNGRVDELKLFGTALTPPEINTIYINELNGLHWNGATAVCGGGFHHLEISDSAIGSGLTCNPSTLTVRACANADCSSLYTGGVSGTLTVSTGTAIWGGGAASFSITSGLSSTTKTLQLTTPVTATVGISTPSPSPTASTVCTFPTAQDCSYTSADSGFIFDIPDHISETQQTVGISAVKKANNSNLCTSTFANVTRDITFICSYSNPTSGTLPVRVAGNAMNAASNTAAACDGSGRAVSLAFNNSGVASTAFLYADAGQVSVNAVYIGSGATAGLTLTGVDTFIAAPKDFAIASTGPFVAGTSFSSTVTARNNSNTATPNFGKEVAPAAVTLTSSNPQPGLGNATTINTSASSFSAGASTKSLTWNEVGTIDLNASSSSYLGSSLNVAGTQTSVGPFKPGYFDTFVTQGCSSAFTYAGLTGTLAGQGFTVQVKAKRSGGTASDSTNTANYTGATWAKDVTLADAAASAGGTLTNTSLLATAFTSGVASRSDVTYTFTNKLTAPYTLAIRATDADATSSGHAEGSTELRSGRLRLSNAFGSEKSNLAMPVQAHYWSGNSWVLNSSDSCTSLLANAFPLSGAAAGTNPSAVALAGGIGTLTLTKPTTPTPGNVDVAINLGASGSDQSCLASHGGAAASQPWLRSQNGNCAATYDRDPSARATFGLYAPETRKNVHVREQF